MTKPLRTKSVAILLVALSMSTYAWAQSALSLDDLFDSSPAQQKATGLDSEVDAKVPLEPASSVPNTASLSLMDLGLDDGRAASISAIPDTMAAPTSSLESMLRSDEIEMGRQQAACDRKSSGAQIVLAALEAVADDACESQANRLNGLTRNMDTIGEANNVKSASNQLRQCAQSMKSSVSSAMSLQDTSPDFSCKAYSAEVVAINKYNRLLTERADQLLSAGDQTSRSASSLIAQIEQRKSDNTGRMIALGFAAIAAGSAADVVGSDKALEMFSATAQDILTDGRAGALNQFKQSLDEELSRSVNTAASSERSSTSNGDGSYRYDITHRFTCPAGNTGAVPIKTNDEACFRAMKRYSETAGCNQIDEMKIAEREYYSACAAEMYGQ